MNHETQTEVRTQAGPARIGLSGRMGDWISLPLVQALSEGRWHQFTYDGPLKAELLAIDFADALVHTNSYHDVESDEDDTGERLTWMVLRIDDDCWVEAGRYRMRVYARDRKVAAEVAEGLSFLYRQRKEVRPPEYQLIKKTDCGIDTEAIPLNTQAGIPEEHLELFYGEEFAAWHESLVEAFNEKNTGITLLEGPPGTGKTSYIRHLMVALKDSHRFYFLPSSNLGVLKDSEFVDFWSSQRRWFPDRRMVVILEDAEEALLPRSSYNRAEVGVLLNITDGMLGEFLKLHIICTVNCPVDHLDPALLRPGRLVARRHFGRMNRERAIRVALALEKPLPPGEDFSLAEIFGGSLDPGNIPVRQIGFAAAQA